MTDGDVSRCICANALLKKKIKFSQDDYSPSHITLIYIFFYFKILGISCWEKNMRDASKASLWVGLKAYTQPKIKSTTQFMQIRAQIGLRLKAGCGPRHFGDASFSHLSFFF